MNYGSAAWGLRETPLEEQFKMTKELGLSYLELGLANAENDITADAEKSELDKVLLYSKKYGVEVNCAATGNDFTVSYEESKKSFEKLKKVIDICEYLNIKYLRIFTGFTPYEKVSEEIWKSMINFLSELNDYSQLKGVTLVVETHGGVVGFDDGVKHFLSTSTQIDCLKRLLKELPEGVKMNFDPANIYAVGYNPCEIFKIIKDRVAYVHLKDFKLLPSGHILPAACGESDMNWKEILQLLKDFNGPAFIEYENTFDIKDGIERSLKFLNITEGK